MERTIQKPTVAAWLTVSALVPWFSGAREPGGIFIDLGLLVLAGFVMWRSDPVPPLKWGVVPTSFSLLGVWSVLSLIWSINRYQTLLWLLMLMLAAAAFVTTRLVLTTKGTLAILRRGYLLVATATSLYGLYDYFVNADFDRLTSWFYWPNTCAVFLVPAVLLGLAALRPVRPWRWRLGIGAVTLINVLAFWLTASRGSALALATVGVVVAIMTVRRHWRWLVVCAAILGAAWLLSLAAPQLRHHTPRQAVVSTSLTNRPTDSTSLTDRKNFLIAAAEIWRDHPVLGTGGGTYGIIHPQYQRAVTSFSANAHNLFAQLFAELGVMGGILGIVLALGLLWQAWTTACRHPQLAVWAAALAALTIHLGLDMDSLYGSVVVLVAICAAVTYDAQSGRRLPHSGALYGVLLVAALFVAYPLFAGYQIAQRAATDQNNADYTDAATEYDQAATGVFPDPNYVIYAGINYYTLAITGEHSQTNLDAAAQRATIGISTDPQDAPGYELRCRVLETQGKLAAAEANCAQALGKDPYDHPENYQFLATLYLKEGKLQEARRLLGRAVKLYDPQSVANRSFAPGFQTAVQQLLLLQQEVSKAQQAPS